MVGRLPTSDVLPGLLADLDEIGFRLGSVDGDLRMRLVRVCGLLSALAAISLVEIRRPLEASRYWRTAQRAAQLFGDRQLHALVRGRRAVFALYGQACPSTILALADDAIGIADGTPSVGAVSAHAARAQMFAQQGCSSEARAALADLEAVFVRHPESVVADRVSQDGLVRHSAALVFEALPDNASTLPVVQQARELLVLPTGAP